jgi:hypothetical protein
VDPFLPRFSRYEVNLPVRFFSSDGLATGRILNVSDSGMLVQFDTPVSIWTMGELTTRIGDRNINIKARTARVEGRKVGMNFMEGTHNNADILRLIDFALERTEERSQQYSQPVTS